MKTIYEGAKKPVGFHIRLRASAGTFVLTNGQYRILDSARAVIVNWASATWDSTALELSAVFDSTATGLTVPGTYYVQFRWTIATEDGSNEVKVLLKEWGP